MVIPPSGGSSRATAPARLKPEEAFNKIDVANKGYVTEVELASAIVQLSPEGVSLSQADAQSVAQEAFKKLDGDGDGKVTLSEFKAGAPKHPPHDGPPPGAGPGGPDVETARSAQTYDPADTDQDGSVSEAERQAYENKQLMGGDASASAR